MTREFIVGLMQALMCFAVFGGLLCLLDVLFRPRRSRYYMARDVHDDQRRIARNGLKTRQGIN